MVEDEPATARKDAPMIAARLTLLALALLAACAPAGPVITPGQPDPTAGLPTPIVEPA